MTLPSLLTTVGRDEVWVVVEIGVPFAPVESVGEGRGDAEFGASAPVGSGLTIVTYVQNLLRPW